MESEGRPRLGHQEAWELLPWYVNGTLAGDERRAVDEHLERCPLCRGELAANEELALAVRRAAEAPAAADDRLGRLLARLDAPGEVESVESDDSDKAAGNEAGAARPFGPPAGRPPFAAPAPSHLPPSNLPPARLPPAVRWALALQAAAVLALALGLAYLLATRTAAPSGPGPAPGTPSTFRTLAAPPPQAAGEGLAVRAVFSPTASEEELRRLLLAAGARFAGGPSPAGVYTLEIAGDREEAAAALARLRRDPWVELAEPVVVRPPAEDAP